MFQIATSPISVLFLRKNAYYQCIFMMAKQVCDDTKFIFFTFLAPISSTTYNRIITIVKSVFQIATSPITVLFLRKNAYNQCISIPLLYFLAMDQVVGHRTCGHGLNDGDMNQDRCNP